MRSLGPSTRGRPNRPTAVDRASRRRAILAVLCLSLVLVSLSNTSLNVALPTLGRVLKAGPSDLQWIVDAYSMAFAALLLTAGALGDRIGPDRALAGGLVVFGTASGGAAWAGSVGQVVAARAVMGVGAALIMPATLSILARVFPPDERSGAIAVWAGVAGVGGATGSIATGWLLQRFWWGSVFTTNVAASALALAAGAWLIPRMGPGSVGTGRPDVAAPVLSSAGMAAVVYAAISAPQRGWLSGPTVLAALVGVGLLSGLAVWELRCRRPMFDVRYFRKRAFTAAASTITVIFFTMYGTVYLVTQYLQLVNGYSPLEAGARLLPVPLVFLIAAPLSARAVARWGQRRVVAGGLMLLASGAFALSRLPVQPDERLVAGALAVMASGMGLTTAPSTAAIMNTVSQRDAGAGSAINDTTRELGGALGVAVIGSVVTTLFTRGLRGVAGSAPASLVEVLGRRSESAPGVVRLADRAYVHALSITFAGLAGMLAASALAVAWLLRSEPRLEYQEVYRVKEPIGAGVPDSQVGATVAGLLAVAGIQPSEAEMRELESSYPELRRALDGLHRLADTRHTAPALVFDASVPAPSWEMAGLLAPSEVM